MAFIAFITTYRRIGLARLPQWSPALWASISWLWPSRCWEKYVWLWAEKLDSGAEIVEYLLETYFLATLYQSYYSGLEQDVPVLLDCLDELALLLELLSIVSQAFLCAVPVDWKLVPDCADELGWAYIRRDEMLLSVEMRDEFFFCLWLLLKRKDDACLK